MPATENADAPLPAAPWAIGLGLAMIVVTIAATFFVQWDYWHRGDLEKTGTPTAVGDTHYAKKPPGKSGGLPGLKYHGEPLEMIKEGKVHDTRLVHADTDDSGYYSLYRLADGKSQALYLKVSPNDYMEVGPEK